MAPTEKNNKRPIFKCFTAVFGKTVKYLMYFNNLSIILRLANNQTNIRVLAQLLSK
jgi:hypothetical protein